MVDAMAQRIDELESDLERAYLLLRHVGAAMSATGNELVPWREAALERRVPPSFSS
jgi:hypothetical protein